MNELLPRLMPGMFLALPGIKLYAICTIILVLKMYAVGIYTGVMRNRHQVVINPEDGGTAQVAPAEHPEVQRVQRVHRNDLENIPAFLIVALLALLLGVPERGLSLCIAAFTLGRVAHTVAYLKALQPWRSMSFGVGLLSSLALMVMIVIRIVS